MPVASKPKLARLNLYLRSPVDTALLIFLTSTSHHGLLIEAFTFKTPGSFQQKIKQKSPLLPGFSVFGPTSRESTTDAVSQRRRRRCKNSGSRSATPAYTTKLLTEW
jgi:hypothetical protein